MTKIVCFFLKKKARTQVLSKIRLNANFSKKKKRKRKKKNKQTKKKKQKKEKKKNELPTLKLNQLLRK